MLEGKDLDWLKRLADILGIQFKDNVSVDEITRMIEAQQQHRIEAALSLIGDAPVVVAEDGGDPIKDAPPKPSGINTPDDVREAIKPITSRREEFVAKFPNDGTWIFECLGAQDSGTLDMPMQIIKNKAIIVSRGRRGLPSHGHDKQDKSYAGKILAV